VADETLDVLARGRVPNLDFFIVPGRGDMLAVEAEGDGQDFVGMSRVPGRLASGVHVPDAHDRVLAAAGEASAVGTEGYGLDGAGVAESAVPEDAGDVVGQVCRRRRQAPARPAKEVLCLEEPVGGEGRGSLLRQGVGPLIARGGKLPGQPLAVGGS